MSTTETIACIQQLFEASCLELFQSLDCTITREENAAINLEHVPLAYIDAGSDDVELVAMLRVPFPVLALSYRGGEEITAVDEAALEDWISELANQLIGKLKNKLIQYGCVLKIGLPTSFFDMEFETLPVAKLNCTTFHFNIDNELFECGLHIELFNKDLVLNLQEQQDGGVGEGELELF